MSEHEIPPHDVEAEIVVLGSLLLIQDPVQAKAVLDVVAPSDFYRGPHAEVLKRQMDLWEGLGACDVVLLRNDLQEAGLLETVGGTSFLSRLVVSVPSTANAVHYARIVRTLSLERRLLAAASAHRQATIEHGNGLAAAAFERLTQAREELERFQRAETAAPRATSWDFADLAREGPAPPPVEFVSRLFVRPSLNMVFGPAQAGKSWAIMALLLDAVLGGGCFLGGDELQILPLRELRDGKDEVALWVFGNEDTKDRVRSRLQTLLASGPHAGKDVPPGRFIIASPPPGVAMNSPSGWRWLEGKIAETKATLVAMDTVASLCGASLDVNKAEQVGPFMGRLLDLRERLNLVVFLLHHTRKGSQDQKRNVGSHADAMLGAQTWRALSEACLMFDGKDGDTAEVHVRSVKAKDVARPIPPLRATLDPQTARFRPLDEDEAPPEREKTGHGGRPSRCSAENVFALRGDFPDGLPWSDVARLLGVPDKTLGNNAARLKGDLIDQGCAIIDGVVRWPSA